MKRLMSLVGIVVASLMMQGCATSPGSGAAQITNNNTNGVAEAAAGSIATDSNPVSPIAICAAAEGCASQTQTLAHGAEVGSGTNNAPLVEGHPLTSVVVTQCNLVVAVYMTMPDGRFLRFDKKAEIPAEQLVQIAYTATRSERVEVSCEGLGAAGFEKHDAV